MTDSQATTRQRVYVDPNFRPDYFYPLLKLLCVLYDQVVVWSPVLGWLEAHGFSEKDFVAACSPSGDSNPVIVPAARDTWFEPHYRSSHPDQMARHFARDFERTLRLRAEGACSILPSSDYELGYQTQAWAHRVNPALGEQNDAVANDLIADFPKEWIARLDAVAAERGKTRSWAVANSYVQDLIACQRLRALPVLRPEQARGYVMLSDGHVQSPLDVRLDVTALSQPNPDTPFPALPREVSVEQLVRFFQDAWRLKDASWSDVAELRKRHGPAIRSWIAECLTHAKRPLRKTISQIAEEQANDLHRRAKRGVELAAPAAVGLIGSTLSTELGLEAAGALYGFLKITRWDTGLIDVFARILGGPLAPSGLRNSFLIDTPFYATAVSANTASGGKTE